MDNISYENTNRWQLGLLLKNQSQNHTNIIPSKQGGILSPLLYIIYVSDFEDWLMHSKASTYADDSGTGVKGNSIAEIVPKLEEDGENVLEIPVSPCKQSE